MTILHLFGGFLVVFVLAVVMVGGVFGSIAWATRTYSRTRFVLALAFSLAWTGLWLVGVPLAVVGHFSGWGR